MNLEELTMLSQQTAAQLEQIQAHKVTYTNYIQQAQQQLNELGEREQLYLTVQQGIEASFNRQAELERIAQAKVPLATRYNQLTVEIATTQTRLAVIEARLTQLAPNAAATSTATATNLSPGAGGWVNQNGQVQAYQPPAPPASTPTPTPAGTNVYNTYATTAMPSQVTPFSTVPTQFPAQAAVTPTQHYYQPVVPAAVPAPPPLGAGSGAALNGKGETVYPSDLLGTAATQPGYGSGNTILPTTATPPNQGQNQIGESSPTSPNEAVNPDPGPNQNSTQPLPATSPTSPTTPPATPPELEQQQYHPTPELPGKADTNSGPGAGVGSGGFDLPPLPVTVEEAGVGKLPVAAAPNSASIGRNGHHAPSAPT